mgnify:CR=1 FL=1
MPRSAQMAQAEQQAYPTAAVNGIYSGKVVSLTGGALVRDAGWSLIGAVGVARDTPANDLVAALAGIEAAGLVGEG